jgi:outer membrane protein OmpA-like peptidoglycan-associated protein
MKYSGLFIAVVAAALMNGCVTGGHPQTQLDTSLAFGHAAEEVERQLNEEVLPEQMYGSHILKPEARQFDLDEWILHATTQEQVKSFAQIQLLGQVWVEDGFPYKLIVVGHTDNSGTKEHNLTLATKRAKHVEQLLIEAGVPCEHLEIRAAPPGEGRVFDFAYQVQYLSR